MNEDSWLEFEYESRNGSDVDIDPLADDDSYYDNVRDYRAEDE